MEVDSEVATEQVDQVEVTLESLEEEFANRYTDADSGYAEQIQKEEITPPVVTDWLGLKYKQDRKLRDRDDRHGRYDKRDDRNRRREHDRDDRSDRRHGGGREPIKPYTETHFGTNNYHRFYY